MFEEKIRLANETTGGGGNSSGQPVDILDPAYAQFRDLTRFWIQRVAVPLIMVIGLFGNLITIIIMTRRRMRSTTNMYLAALAFVDMLYLVLTFVLGLSHYPNMAERKYYFYWRLKPFLMMLTDACSNTSVWLTVTFTIERYIAVKYPMRGKVWCTEARAKKLIAFVFAFSILFALPVPFEWEVVERGPASENGNTIALSLDNTEFGRDEVYKTIYYRLTAIMFYFLPLLSVTLFNGFLIRSVHQSKKERNRMTNKPSVMPAQNRSSAAQQKLASIYKFNSHYQVKDSKDEPTELKSGDCEVKTMATTTTIKERLLPRGSSLVGGASRPNGKSSRMMPNHTALTSTHIGGPIKICVKLHEASNGKIGASEQQDCSGLFMVVQNEDSDKNVSQFESNETTLAASVPASVSLTNKEGKENIMASSTGTNLDISLSLPNQTSFATCQSRTTTEARASESLDNGNGANSNDGGSNIIVLGSSEILPVAFTRETASHNSNGTHGCSSVGIGGSFQCGSNNSVSMVSAGATSNVPVIAASSQERRITIMLIAVVLLFLVCQIPSAAMLLYTAVRDTQPNTNEHALLLALGNIFNFLMAINAAGNFILYSFLSKKYRRTFVILFCSCLSAKDSKTFHQRPSQSIKSTSQHSQNRAFASCLSTTSSNVMDSEVPKRRNTNNVRFTKYIQSCETKGANNLLQQSGDDEGDVRPDTLV